MIAEIISTLSTTSQNWFSRKISWSYIMELWRHDRRHS